MRALSNSDFLHLWERGSRLHPLDRALLALSAALPEAPSNALADWPLGRRNAALAQLRQTCFGAALRSWVACPKCGERLEFELDAELLTSGNSDSQQPVVANGRTFRLPTSRDLAAMVNESDPQLASRRLLQLCCLDAADTAEWADEELEEVGEHLAHADPLAETRLTLRCITCGNLWEEALDLASYVWTEIEVHAHKLLSEIHTLASAYGWSEADILRLSEPRRAVYLEMVQA